MPKSKPILIIDTREKQPWCFDDDDDFQEIIHRKLDYGDYSIEGLEDRIFIERKSSANELLSNFSVTANRKRLFRIMEESGDQAMRFLVIECTLEQLSDPASYFVNSRGRFGRSQYAPVAVVLQNLVKLMIDYNVHVIFGGLKAQSIAKGILKNFFEKNRELIDA